MAKAKKELTVQQKRVQAVFNWILNILCIVIILFALVMSIFTIAQTADDNNLPHLGKSYYIAVISDSMSGTFEPSDIIIAKEYDGADTLAVGQVITFKVTVGNSYYINTHRIVAVNDLGEGRFTYSTQGDKEGLTQDTRTVGSSDIIATWGSPSDNGKVMKNIGALNLWLSGYDKNEDNGGVWEINEDALTKSGNSIRYFLCIVLPLILLFVVYAFVLIRSLMLSKLKKQEKIAVNSLSDDEKERLAKEYLASKGIDADSVKADVPTEIVLEETEPAEEQTVEAQNVEEVAPIEEVKAEEPVVEPVAEPVEEPVVEPVEEEPAVEPVVEPAVEPVVEPAVEPAVEPVVEHVAEPQTEPQAEITEAKAEEPAKIEAKAEPKKSAPKAKKASAPKAEKADVAKADTAKADAEKADDEKADDATPATVRKAPVRKEGVPRDTKPAAKKTAAKKPASTASKSTKKDN